MTLSLILPVYNPAAGWADIVLQRSAEISAICEEQIEVIVVNDGSDNDFYKEERQRISHLCIIDHEMNKGKGEAIRTGVRASSGSLIVYTDIDFPYTTASVVSLIDLLRSREANIAIGIKDHSYYDHVPAVRRFISRLFRFFVRLLLQIPTDDTQCGLKGFDQKGKAIFLRTSIERYLFDLEFIFLASRRRDICIQTREIQLRKDVEFRRMNLGIILNEAMNFLKILLYSFTNSSR